MAIAWTAALRAELAPREARPSTVNAPAAWLKVRTAIPRARFDRGLTHEGAAVDAMKAAIALLSTKDLSKSASPEAVGATLVIAQQCGRGSNMMAAIGATLDAARITEALVRAHALSQGVASAYPAQWLVEQPSATPMGWRVLRECVLRDGETAALAIAKSAWTSAPLSLKIVFAYAFPSAHEWAAEAAHEIAALPTTTKMIVAPIFATLRDPTHLGAVLAHRSGAHPLVDAVENLGEDALPAFVGAWDLPIGDRIHLARATSAYVDERAAKVLAKEIDKTSTGEIAREYFVHHPDLAELALATKAKTKFGALAADVLASAKRTHEKHDEIPLEDLPMVLASPPWTGGVKTRQPIACTDPPTSPRAETITVDTRRKALLARQVGAMQYPEATGELRDAFVAKAKSGEIGLGWWYERSRVPHATLVELITTIGFGAQTPTYFPFAAATLFGDVVVPALCAWAVANRAKVATNLRGSAVTQPLLEIDSHRLASVVVDAFEQNASREIAWKYFFEHVDATIIGVTPIAVGRVGETRRAAETILRKLAVHHGEHVRSLAKSAYGDRVAEALEEVLSFDGRFDCPRSPPKLPAEWRPRTFTRPHAKDGRALPIEAVEHIGHMLAFSDPEAPYVGLADVRAACEPRSLAELAWDIGRAWERAGTPTRSSWMLESIAHFGDDEVIRRTTPAIKTPAIVGVLGRAATDAAATELCTIAWRIKNQKARTWRARHWGTQQNVTNAFAELARRRGVTVDQVEDSLAPMLSLREPRLTLDYGSRTILVGFDERLDPFIESARGKLRKLPKKGKKDDAAKVEHAERIWQELLEDVTAIADFRLDSLERAMISARPWTLDAFRRAWTDHPLMRHLARGIVWRAGSASFRIAEDGTFADHEDAAFTATDAPIFVAHPAELREDVRDAWRRVFLDYKITQPLEQLDRRLLVGASGASITLVPDAPRTSAEATEKLRAAGFTTEWRNREQVALRVCARTSDRLRISLVIEDRKLATVTLAAEDDVDLSRIHPVDSSEIVHTLSLRPM